MSTFRTFRKPVVHNPVPYIKGAIQWIVISCSEIVFIVIMQRVAYAIQYGESEVSLWTYALRFLIAVIGAFLVKLVIRNRRRPNTQFVSDDFFRKYYFERLLHINSSYIEKRGTGRVLDVVQKGIDMRRRTIEVLVQALPDIVIKLLFSVYIIQKMGWGYAVGYIMFLIAVIFFSVYLNRFAIKNRHERKLFEMSMSRRLVKFLMARIEIMYANSLQKETQKQHEDLAGLRDVNATINIYLYLMYNIPVTAVQMLVFLIIMYSIQTLQSGEFSYATFTGMMSIIGFLMPMVINYTSKMKDFTKDFIHIEKLREIVDDAPRINNYDTGKEFVFKKGDIVFEKVTFSYDTKSMIVQDLDLTIAGGKKTAFVGESGAGKSTIVKMIAGLIAPDQGNVVVDGQSLQEISLKSYYSHIGYLAQEPGVFDGTVYENLVYALHTMPTQTEVEKVLQLAKCEFVYNFAHGVDTEIGERGIRLSGGQRQRLAIAKMFLKNPEIILLDEPTSALDSFSEEAITEAMRNLFNGRTVLIIAHRLQTVKQADDIIVLDKGTVIERGTHTELLQKGGSYARMLELQAGF